MGSLKFRNVPSSFLCSAAMFNKNWLIDISDPVYIYQSSPVE